MTNFKIKLPSGRYRAATVNEVLEAASEYVQERDAMTGITIKSPEATKDYLRGVYAGLEREKFGIMFLDNRHHVIGFEFMFSGTIDGTSVYPREVVKRALEVNAAAVILSHNHPSGIATPSEADERITRRLKSALELVEIRLLDHLIVGRDDITSLASRGLL